MKVQIIIGLLASALTFLLPAAFADDDYSCSATRPCSNGACCGASSFCGYGPVYCGTGCQSNCTAKAECGEYAATPNTKCPLNVCCSQFGFCGTTSEFCDSKQGCQSGCGTPSRPSSNGNTASQRVIGYFESWAGGRACDQWDPTMISARQLTHLNFAFSLIDSSNRITPASTSDTALYREVMNLKSSNPDLKIFISVGGWSFNDPGSSQRRFSIMASSKVNRAAFISSSLQFMKTYGFDGLDLDWEYPVDDLRGGRPEDKENLNTLVKEFRAAIRSSGTKYGLTITTPSSYYYLRHFDLAELIKWIDWFNVMSYDLHGVWDKDNKYLGPYINSHSNLTEIDISLDLFWRNKIPASEISLGLGFYGRSFQLKSTSCTKPGCVFKGPANAGPCTGEAGILSFAEIARTLGVDSDFTTEQVKATVVWDKTAAVKYATWDDQWVSYDDKDTFKQKIDYANKLGLGGMLIWAVDQDNGNYDAMNAISNTVGTQNPKLKVPVNNQKVLIQMHSMKDNCHATECSEDPTCPAGFSAIAVGGKPDRVTAPCKKGLKQLICCSSNNMPQSCRWAGGAPNCEKEGQCHQGEEELARDSYGDGAKCVQGSKALCCVPPKAVADALHQCKWAGTAPFCGNDGLCSDPGYPVQVTYGSGLGGNGAYCSSGNKVLCCPTADTYTNCKWEGGSTCTFSSCQAGKVSIASDSEGGGGDCWLGNRRNYCCDTPTVPAPDPPAQLNGHWGSPADEGCKGNGYRQWSSKLLDINGDWEKACENHPAWIKKRYFLKPTSCDKSIFGIWGKFWVPDSKCCSKKISTRLTLQISPLHTGSNLFEAYSTHFPGGCEPPYSGVIEPAPINRENALLAYSVFTLLTTTVMRDILQIIWDNSFPGPNLAGETGAFIFQHRTVAGAVQVWVGALARGGPLADQRYPENGGTFQMINPGNNPEDVRMFPIRDDDVEGRFENYVLIAVVHTHPFLYNLNYGLRPEPSEADHRSAWAYGIPMLIVSRRGVYLAGPARRITRNSVDDTIITEEIGQGVAGLRTNFPIVPYDQIPPYDEDMYNPIAGGIRFIPRRAENELQEPTNGVPLFPDGMAISSPNPHQGEEDIGPEPGSGQ